LRHRTHWVEVPHQARSHELPELSAQGCPPRQDLLVSDAQPGELLKLRRQISGKSFGGEFQMVHVLPPLDPGFSAEAARRYEPMATYASFRQKLTILSGKIGRSCRIWIDIRSRRFAC
jgi:hypothetical protein